MRHIYSFAVFALFFGLQEATAQNNEKIIDSLKTVTGSEVLIVEDRSTLFKKVPGALTVVTSKDIVRIGPLSGNEVFRKVPGLNVVDEEGLGLRVNIGIRGVDPDRSRGVLMLEDGVPIALNPYGEPEMYYTPPIERMSGIEVLKGSGQILYGPQTIGGIINYITAEPPSFSKGFVKLTGGEGGLFNALVSYGNTFNTTGLLVTYLRKSGNNVGKLNYDINDISTKFRFRLSDNSSLGVKLGVYDELSNASYVGLTEHLFQDGRFDQVNLTPDDQLTVRRYSLSATHSLAFNSNTRIRTTVYGYTTTRNWIRQDFSYSPTASNQTGVSYGDPNSGGAIFLRNSTGARNRQFEVAGVEPRLTHEYGSNFHKLDAGARINYERAFEQRVNGTKGNAKSGSLIEDEIRTGYGFSAFVQNTFNINNKFSVTPGIRFENFDYERNILRRRFNNVVRDTSLVANSTTNEIIPGLGLNYNLSEKVSIYGGVHRGFAPPRVKDAITSAGEALDLDAELSWNYELGLRTQLVEGLKMEATAFFLDFSNQIIPVSQSSGGTGTGLVNGGETEHKGVEFGIYANLGTLFKSKYTFDVDLSTTFVDAKYSSDRFVQSGNNTVNIKGNQTPYAPKITVNAAFNFETPGGFGFGITANHVGEQMGDELNLQTGSINGLNGKLDAYTTLDATLRYNIKPLKMEFNASVKNLTNERYIYTRRPEGIRVSIPRYIMAGLNFNF